MIEHYVKIHTIVENIPYVSFQIWNPTEVACKKLETIITGSLKSKVEKTVSSH